MARKTTGNLTKEGEEREGHREYTMPPKDCGRASTPGQGKKQEVKSDTLEIS